MNQTKVSGALAIEILGLLRLRRDVQHIMSTAELCGLTSGNPSLDEMSVEREIRSGSGNKSFLHKR